MNVRDIMTKQPEYLSSSTTLKEAAEEMAERDFGFIPIGEDDRLIGVVTDRDITIRAVAEGKDPEKTSVKDVMTKNVLYCYEEDDVNAAAESMCKQQVRRLIVLNKNKRFTGVVSLGDIATKVKDKELCNHLIKGVCEETH